MPHVGFRGQVLITAAAMCFLTVGSVRAELGICPGGSVSVNAPSQSLRTQVCQAVASLGEVLDQCDIPRPAQQVTINVTEGMEPGCVGIYHCDEDLIEVLSPEAMDQRRGTLGVFGGMERDAFFTSIVVHEFAHAVADSFPCPSGNCVLPSEYAAYVLQILSMPPTERAVFEQRAAIDDPVTLEQLSGAILLFAPDLFTARVWAHFKAQPDACGYLREMLEGRISLTIEEP